MSLRGVESDAGKPYNDGMTMTANKFQVEAVRRDFPILATQAHGRPLVYLDNAATTQKPRAVIDALVRYYERENSNIHRGVYELSQKATSLYEAAREKVRQFIHAREAAEVIFTRGTTESINLVAASWGRANLRPGDVVVVSNLEHHSNIVPWQLVCAAMGAVLKVIPIDDAGDLVMDEYRRLLAEGGVKMVSVNHVSNALGTINPVEEIIRLGHAAGAIVMIDGAQWVAHGITDVQALDCDFYAFSGHKMMAPTGIGILYGKRALLEAMPPYQGGGDMIASVTFPKTEYAGLPNKFEAGTPNVAGAAGLGAAVDYLTGLDLRQTSAYEHELLEYATGRLPEVPGLRIVGTARKKAAVISFVVQGFSTLDIGVGLDRFGVCVRTGHHCCQPVMDRLGVGSTVRVSLAFYNTPAEIDALVAGLKELAAKKGKGDRGKGKGTDGKIEYPGPAAKSVAAAAAALAEEFEFLGDREAKNEYVLDLAAKLPALFDLLRQVTERVPGCMSQVYLVGRKKGEGESGKGEGNGKRAGGAVFEFVADADAEIVRGLIAILERIYSGQPAKDVAAFDIEAFFGRIGLEQFITSQRRNGLAGMVARIRGLAREMA
jgi:cysteine desulfurase / selenocysteine lyase